MTRFHLEWLRCLDGYRIERRPISPLQRANLERSREWLEGTTLQREIGIERVVDCIIVPKSRNRWEPHRPLEIDGVYRQFANWDCSESGLLKLINAFGFLDKAKAKEVEAGRMCSLILRIRDFVEAIEHQDWQSIVQGLDRVGQARLGIDVSTGQPALKIHPASLFDALLMQAAADACYGIKLRECKNPECDRWFPIEGSGAYRRDAEYHSPTCQRRHTYLKRLKKERRS